MPHFPWYRIGSTLWPLEQSTYAFANWWCQDHNKLLDIDAISIESTYTLSHWWCQDNKLLDIDAIAIEWRNLAMPAANWEWGKGHLSYRTAFKPLDVFHMSSATTEREFWIASMQILASKHHYDTWQIHQPSIQTHLQSSWHTLANGKQCAHGKLSTFCFFLQEQW